MKITYTQIGDYLLSNIVIPETSHHTLGKYGRMRRSYLKEHRPILWDRMILGRTLRDHLASVDSVCNERMDTLIEGVKKTRGTTEALKASFFLQLFELVFGALTSGAAPVVGESLKLCSRGDVLLRVALLGIIDVPAGAFVPSVAQA